MLFLMAARSRLSCSSISALPVASATGLLYGINHLQLENGTYEQPLLDLRRTVRTPSCSGWSTVRSRWMYVTTGTVRPSPCVLSVARFYIGVVYAMYREVWTDL